MFERYAIVGVVSLAIFGVAVVVAVLHSQLRMKRHLNRLKSIPLDQWNSRG